MSESATSPSPRSRAPERLVPVWVSRTMSVLYVATVAALATDALGRQQQGFRWSEAAALILTLPMVVPALPLIYVFGAAIWNATRADSGGPMWPVTLVYSSMFAIIALVNVLLLHRVLTLRRHARTVARDAGPTR